MPAEKKVHQLNIFLVKPAFTTTEQVIDENSCEPPVEAKIAGHGSGYLFVKKTPPVPPKWAALFEDYVDTKTLALPGVAAAFFMTVNGRCFVLAFGQGG